MKKFISLVFGIFCTSVWTWGQITPNHVEVIEATCFGANDAKVVVSNITAIAGSAPFRIQFIQGTDMRTETTSGNSFTFDNVTAPAYVTIIISETVAGRFQRISEQSVETVQPSQLQQYGILETKEDCNGKGSISFSVGGATAPYTATLSGGPTSGQILDNPTGVFSFTDLEPGTYTVTVTDARGCNPPLVITDQTIRPYTPLVGTVSSTDILCFGDDAGSVLAVGQGGFPDYLYILDDGVNFESNNTGIFNNQPAGTGDITIIDKIGCIVKLPYQIEELSTELELRITDQADPRCPGYADGNATVDASGGTPAYDYRWYDSGNALIGQGTAISGLIDGLYRAVVTDANSCTDTVSVTISPVDPVTADVTSTNITCTDVSGGDGTITVSNPQGGNGKPFTGILKKDGSDFDTDEVIDELQPEIKYTGLDAGNYTIVIHDQKGCPSATYSHTITRPDPIAFVPESTDLTCFESGDGRVAVANVQGGSGVYTYSWVNDADPGTVISTDPEVTGLPEGSYTVTIADDALPACISTPTAISITQPGELSIQEISGDINLDCASDETSLTVFLDKKDPLRDVEYSIDGTVWTAENSFLVGKGTYTFRVRYAAPNNACEQSADITVNAPDNSIQFTQVDVAKTALDCFDETTEIFVKITETVATADDIEISHNGTDWVTIDKEQGYTFAGISKGTYHIIARYAGVTDCETTSDEIVIDAPEAVAITFEKTDATGCNGETNGSATISVSGGTGNYSYRINGGAWVSFAGNSTVIPDLAKGSYAIDVTDGNNCGDAVQVTIDAPAEIVITASTVKEATCDDPDGRVEITAQGGTGTLTLTFNEQNVAGTLDDVNANRWLFTQTVQKGGNAIIKVVDANSCENVDTVQIPYSPSLVFTQKSSTQNACAENTDATITALAAFSDPSATPASLIYELYEGIATSGTPISTVTKTALGEPAVFSRLPNGTYTVSVHDQTPCYSEDWIVTLESPDIVVDAKFPDSSDPHSMAVCPDEPVTIQGSISITGADNPEVSAYWEYPGGNVEAFDPNAAVLIQRPESGLYKLVAQVTINGSSCTNESAVTVDYKPLPVVAFAVDTIYIPKEDTYQLNIETEDYSDYLWTSVPDGHTAGLSDPGVPAYIASPDHPYLLILTVINDGHCSQSDTVYIHQSLNFFIPNGFTPNGDGIHDLWVFNHLEQYSGFYSIDVIVFNRAGIQVYEGKGYNNSSVVFDGRLNGKDLPIGTYYYVVKAGPRTLKGTVTILR